MSADTRNWHGWYGTGTPIEEGTLAIKDSGKRQQFASGMVRDVTDGKVDYGLALDGPMFDRYARHLTEGAKKYAKRNWMLADDQEALDRFRESALRHFMQWYRGDVDEDHAAAVYFNVNGAEYVRERLVGAVILEGERDVAEGRTVPGEHVRGITFERDVLADGTVVNYASRDLPADGQCYVDDPPMQEGFDDFGAPKKEDSDDLPF